MLFARIDPPHAPQTRLGRVLDLAGLDFGGGCESPSPSWPSLGGISGVLERFVCASRTLLGAFWLILGASCMHLGSWGRPRPRFWKVFGGSGVGPLDFSLF